jgi:hypothetical protein
VTYVRLVAFITLGIPLPAFAQEAARPQESGRVAEPRDSVPQSVAEAERQALMVPSLSESESHVFQNVDSAQSGTSDRKCVEVGNADYVRSGDFVVGFATYAANWRSGYGKLAWEPVHGSRSSPQDLVVSASRLDKNELGHVFAAHLNRGARFFYPSGIHLPSAGRWLLVARAANTWGCFVYTLQ